MGLFPTTQFTQVFKLLIRLNRFFIWEKIAIDLINFFRFIAIYCDFLGLFGIFLSEIK